MRAVFPLLVLIAAAAAAAEPPVSSPASSAEKDKLICKREVPVGSLIATRKMCLTKAEWQKRADQGNALARGLVEDSAGACGANGGVCPF
jgi:predicted secreted protein